MDTAWMREKLDLFIQLCDRYDAEYRRTYDFTALNQQLLDQSHIEWPTVEKILHALDPRLLIDVVSLDYDGHNVADRCRQGLGILNDRDEWRTRLAPDAPTLVADQMHPLIWAAASTIWSTGEFRVAVGQAAVALNAHLKKKAGSTLNDRELVQQVFAPSPPSPTQIRLHLPGDPSDRTWKSQQEGLHHLGQGAFAGIRNVAAHTDLEWSEHEGLEHLAILSVVARWADQTVLTRPEDGDE